MREVVIAGAARTPIGAFGGTLKDVPARQLGAICIREALQRAGVDPATVDEVVMGNVLQAGLGQNVARQMAMDAGVPKKLSQIRSHSEERISTGMEEPALRKARTSASPSILGIIISEIMRS